MHSFGCNVYAAHGLQCADSWNAYGTLYTLYAPTWHFAMCFAFFEIYAEICRTCAHEDLHCNAPPTQLQGDSEPPGPSSDSFPSRALHTMRRRGAHCTLWTPHTLCIARYNLLTAHSVLGTLRALRVLCPLRTVHFEYSTTDADTACCALYNCPLHIADKPLLRHGWGPGGGGYMKKAGTHSE